MRAAINPKSCFRKFLERVYVLCTWRLIQAMIHFETWYQREYPRIVNTLTLTTGDQQVAADAASEAFVRALAKWDRVSVMERPGGWLYKVALNDARRRLRKARRDRDTAADVPWAPTAASPVEPDHELWAAVARLPQRTREAVVLRYVADLTEPAIADALGVRRGTVATMLRRANEKLATELGPGRVDQGTILHALQ